jgi:hypothetical protein
LTRSVVDFGFREISTTFPSYGNSSQIHKSQSIVNVETATYLDP